MGLKTIKNQSAAARVAAIGTKATVRRTPVSGIEGRMAKLGAWP
jgi:hypothetical protein